MRDGQGGIWLSAAVISGVSTAASALQMAMTDWITRSAFSGKSPWGESGVTWDPRAAEGPPRSPHIMHGEMHQPVPQFPLLSQPFPFSAASLVLRNETRKKPAVNKTRRPQKCPVRSHLGCQESVHLVVEGVEEETQGLSEGQRAELSPARRVPGAGVGPTVSPLPADGLFDGSLLQVDVVVEGGRALVIARLEMERGCAKTGLHTCAPTPGRCHGRVWVGKDPKDHLVHPLP